MNANGNPVLPWQNVTRDGYAKLDRQLVVGGQFGTLTVHRMTPGDPLPGNFVVLHNGNRISGDTHTQRPDAVAEAERYLYSSPIFSGSGQAVVIATKLEAGRQAYRDGLSIYQNPFNAATDPEDRAHWAEGWMQSFGATVSAKAVNAAVATAQANEGLIAQVRGLLAVIRFARDAQANEVHAFLNDVLAEGSSPDTLIAKWPTFTVDTPEPLDV